LKQRRVRFTSTAQKHVEREKAWWLKNRDHAEVFAEELEQALKGRRHPSGRGIAVHEVTHP
jgi:hypothetical protein